MDRSHLHMLLRCVRTSIRELYASKVNRKEARVHNALGSESEVKPYLSFEQQVGLVFQKKVQK